MGARAAPPCAAPCPSGVNVASALGHGVASGITTGTLRRHCRNRSAWVTYAYASEPAAVQALSARASAVVVPARISARRDGERCAAAVATRARTRAGPARTAHAIAATIATVSGPSGSRDETGRPAAENWMPPVYQTASAHEAAATATTTAPRRSTTLDPPRILSQPGERRGARGHSGSQRTPKAKPRFWRAGTSWRVASTVYCRSARGST